MEASGRDIHRRLVFTPLRNACPLATGFWRSLIQIQRSVNGKYKEAFCSSLFCMQFPFISVDHREVGQPYYNIISLLLPKSLPRVRVVGFSLISFNRGKVLKSDCIVPFALKQMARNLFFTHLTRQLRFSKDDGLFLKN